MNINTIKIIISVCIVGLLLAYTIIDSVVNKESIAKTITKSFGAVIVGVAADFIVMNISSFLANQPKDDPTVQTVSSPIPSDAIVFDGHSYARRSILDIGKYPCTFNDVENYCESLGGHLAVINNVEENFFLYDNYCVDGKTPVFFGYTDQDEEDNWVWIWGDSDYVNWTQEGQVHPAPDNHGSKGVAENYAEFNYGDPGANDGSWNDAAFTANTDYFIIEWEF